MACRGFNTTRCAPPVPPVCSNNRNQIIEVLKTLILCPIGLSTNVDCIADDGYGYNRENLDKWLNENPTSPFTRKPIKNIFMLGLSYIRELLNKIQNRIVNEEDLVQNTINVLQRYLKRDTNSSCVLQMNASKFFQNIKDAIKILRELQRHNDSDNRSKTEVNTLFNINNVCFDYILIKKSPLIPDVYKKYLFDNKNEIFKTKQITLLFKEMLISKNPESVNQLDFEKKENKDALINIFVVLSMTAVIKAYRMYDPQTRDKDKYGRFKWNVMTKMQMSSMNNFTKINLKGFTFTQLYNNLFYFRKEKWE